MHCAPNIYANKEKPINKSCFNLSKLKKIASHYNKKYDDKINLNIDNPDELYNIIKNKLGNKCGNNELCWIRQDFVKRSNDKDLLKFTFKPPKPKGGKYSWLSTTNLVDVMNQYELFYKDFKFIGALPIDFMDVYPEYVKLKFDDLYKKGITRYGIILNTDPSYKSGEHWMSMFIDLRKTNPSISFYDSVATCPAPKEILKYINYILKYTKKIQKLWNNNNEIKIHCNNVQHQKKNSECGTYSLFYITESLKNKTFDQISKKIIKDEEMNKKRDIFFSPNK